MSLADAYARHQKHLPPLYRALIRAGTASGDLPSVLDEIARHASERARVASRVRQALFQPLVSAIAVIVLGLVLLCYLGPQVEGLHEWGWMPGFFARFTPTGWWQVAPWAVVGAAVLSVVGVLAFAWFRNPLDAGAGPRAYFFRFPFFGRIRTYAAQTGFASTMAMLLGRRLPLPMSLELTAAATQDPRVATQIGAMHARAEAGESLTESVEAGALISPAMMWFVEAGEASGTVATSFADVARVYQQRLDRSVDRFCFLIGPVALLMVGVLVAIFALIYVAPIYDTVSKMF